MFFRFIYHGGPFIVELQVSPFFVFEVDKDFINVSIDKFSQHITRSLVMISHWNSSGIEDEAVF